MHFIEKMYGFVIYIYILSLSLSLSLSRPWNHKTGHKGQFWEIKMYA